jgi:hypothetical protein
VVSPTAAAVLSAANEVTDELTSSFLSPDIFNGNLSTSWPLCLTNYFVIYQSRNLSDCSYTQNLLAFIAWSQLNPHTFSKVQDLGYSPLPFGFKTYPRPHHMQWPSQSARDLTREWLHSHSCTLTGR